MYVGEKFLPPAMARRKRGSRGEFRRARAFRRSEAEAVSSVQRMFERSCTIPPKLNFPIFCRPVWPRKARQGTETLDRRAMNDSNEKFFLNPRKSTDVEHKQVWSIEDQITELRAYAKQEDIYIAEIFIEKQNAKILLSISEMGHFQNRILLHNQVALTSSLRSRL